MLKHVRIVGYLLLNHALTKTGTKYFMIIDENSDDEIYECVSTRNIPDQTENKKKQKSSYATKIS